MTQLLGYLKGGLGYDWPVRRSSTKFDSPGRRSPGNFYAAPGPFSHSFFLS